MSKEVNVSLSPWEAWQDLPPSTWQKAIKFLVLHIAEDQKEASSDYRLLDGYIDEIRAKDPKANQLLDGAVIGVWADAVEVGAIIGYALARTQPGALEEFGDWPRRALELAGLPVPKEDDEEDPPNAA